MAHASTGIWFGPNSGRDTKEPKSTVARWQYQYWTLYERGMEILLWHLVLIKNYNPRTGKIKCRLISGVLDVHFASTGQISRAYNVRSNRRGGVYLWVKVGGSGKSPFFYNKNHFPLLFYGTASTGQNGGVGYVDPPLRNSIAPVLNFIQLAL